MKVTIGDMTFEGDPKSLNDCEAYKEFLAAAVEIEKARGSRPVYPVQWYDAIVGAIPNPSDKSEVRKAEARFRKALAALQQDGKGE